MFSICSNVCFEVLRKLRLATVPRPRGLGAAVLEGDLLHEALRLRVMQRVVAVVIRRQHPGLRTDPGQSRAFPILLDYTKIRKPCVGI